VSLRIAKSEDKRNLRMRELCREVGCTRQTIHFYLRSGILPSPRASGKNTALYGDEHIRGVLTIKRLQDEFSLPIRAIKDLFDAEVNASLTGAQRAILMRAYEAIRTEDADVLDASRSTERDPVEVDRPFDTEFEPDSAGSERWVAELSEAFVEVLEREAQSRRHIVPRSVDRDAFRRAARRACAGLVDECFRGLEQDN